MQKIIYMDNAATTKPYPESIEAMLKSILPAEEQNRITGH